VSETRKIAAILAADVVGFSRLTGRQQIARMGEGLRKAGLPEE
jgi:class 3 adenylate cyclase